MNRHVIEQQMIELVKYQTDMIVIKKVDNKNTVLMSSRINKKSKRFQELRSKIISLIEEINENESTVIDQWEG